MYFLLDSTSILIKIMCIMFIASAESRSTRKPSRHPDFMGNCPTINHECQSYLPWAIARLLITSASPIYLVDESHFMFKMSIPPRPTQQREGWCNLVCMECL